MSKPRKTAGLAAAVSFAHLLPSTPPAATRAAADDDDDDSDKDRPDAEEDDDDQDDKKPAGRKAKKARADDQGNDDGEDDGASADDGDDEDDSADAEDDDGDDKKPAGKRAKKARAENGDDDDDTDDDASARAGAMRERRRCAAIFASRHAAGRPDLAAHLAFSTNMSAAEAIGTMKTLVGGQAAGARASLADRMRAESVPNPGQGSAAAPTGTKGLAAAMLAASKKAQGQEA